MLTLLLLILAASGGASPSAECTANQSLGDCTFSSLSALFGPGQCPPAPAGQPAATSAAMRLQQLIEATRS